MKSMQVEIPDQLAQEIETLVGSGWFADGSELMRVALVEFIRRHRFEIVEQFQRDEIAWSLTQKESPA